MADNPRKRKILSDISISPKRLTINRETGFCEIKTSNKFLKFAYNVCIRILTLMGEIIERNDAIDSTTDTELLSLCYERLNDIFMELSSIMKIDKFEPQNLSNLPGTSPNRVKIHGPMAFATHLPRNAEISKIYKLAKTINDKCCQLRDRVDNFGDTTDEQLIKMCERVFTYCFVLLKSLEIENENENKENNIPPPLNLD